MDELTTNPALLGTKVEPSESLLPEPPKKTYSKVELSSGVQAFIDRMAENLRTHNPDAPKGRNRPY